MRFPALSVIAPAGTWIREGRKTIEVRSWRPEASEVRDLLIVQNRHRLDPSTLPSDPDGEAVARVNVVRIRPWLREDVAAACGQVWTEGYFAWELADVRPIRHDSPVTARLGIYFLEFAPEELRRKA